MSGGFEAFLQVVGVAAGVAGAWYAFKQYRLSSTSERHENRSGPSGVQTFVSERHTSRGEQIGALLYGGFGALGLLWVLLAEDDFEDGGHRVFVGIVMGAFLMAGMFLLERSEAPFTIELSDRHLTVRQVYRQPRELRIAWDRVDHFADLYQDSQRRELIAVLPADSGYLPELPQNRYSKGDGGYVLCDFTKVRPSKNAFREAVTRYSGLEVR
ncbi:hypothetical protein AB0B28_16000 [Glycomyces sp. NPDC046736]|uniref:hypothetical protein n=1 Tax=Glycomyces sp. NPDC046736 TaxID=3155615 RepID=UPI0033E65A44